MKIGVIGAGGTISILECVGSVESLKTAIAITRVYVNM